MIAAYFVRFYSLAFNGIKSSYLKINQSIDDSSYLLGYSKFRTFRKIHFPNLKNSIYLISILIAIEIIKVGKVNCKVFPILSKDYVTKVKRPHYSVLNKSKIKLDRKVLAELAYNNPEVFKSIVKKVQSSLN